MRAYFLGLWDGPLRRRLENRFAYRISSYFWLVKNGRQLGARRVRHAAFALSAGAVPLFQGGGPEPTMTTTTATVLAGRLVEVSGDRSIRPAVAGSAKVVGVAKQTSDAIGDKVSVSTSGVWRIIAQGAIAAGDQVIASADGLGKVSTLAVAGAATAADINNARSVVGRALSAAIDGAACPVLLTFG